MRRLLPALALLILAGGALAGDTEISGFADAAYFVNTADRNGEFGLDQVEIDVIHQAGDRTSVRADIEWVKDGEEFVAQIEQGYMTALVGDAWEFSFGKFNAPIGFELLDAPDMYQYSHALVFDHGLPTNLTGASLARALNEDFDVIAYVANGWDANAAAGANATWGGRLGFARGDLGCGLSAIAGKEEMDATAGGPDAFRRTVIDVDASYARDRWLFGGEFNRGSVTTLGPTEQDLEWSGFLLMANVALDHGLGLTFRYDRFDDQDGWAFGDVGGEFQVRQAFTVSPSLAIDDGFGALVELRIDKSDRDAFRDGDGEPTDTSTAIAFEMTYAW